MRLLALARLWESTCPRQLLTAQVQVLEGAPGTQELRRLCVVKVVAEAGDLCVQ